MAGLLWYRSYMDSLANTNGYYPDIHAGHADRVTELTLDAPYLIRETPARYNQLELMELVGGTVAWNQLVDKTAWPSSSGLFTNNGDGSITANGTASGNQSFGYDVTFFQTNHIYLADSGNSSQGSSTTFEMMVVNFSAQGTNLNVYTNAVIKKMTNTTTNTQRIQVVVRNGYTVTDLTWRPQIVDLTQMFGSTIADYVYTLEQSTAGSGIAWLQSYGFFTEDYIPYSAATLQSVEATAHVTKDANNTTIATYPLDSDLVLRGIPELVNGTLRYNGDTYEWDGTVTRNYGTRAYQAGDESLTDAITDGTNTVYKLTTPTTESADPFTAVQTVEEGGTEEFVTSNNVPAGNVSVYRRA